MKRWLIVLMFGIALPLFGQSDADTLMRVQKARAEAPACSKMLKESEARGSVDLNFWTVSKLDKEAEDLTHCGFVFRILGQTELADRAGNEADRYDAAIASQMRNYLKWKGLWSDFLKSDCRTFGTACGKAGQ